MPTNNIHFPLMADMSQILDQIGKIKLLVNEVTGISKASRGDKLFPYSSRLPVTETREIETEVRLVPYTYIPKSEVFEFVESDLMTVLAEDWSRVRSPSRAIRRRKRGFRQNIRYYQAPDPDLKVMGTKIIGHPVTLSEFRDRIKERSERIQDEMIERVLKGGIR